MCALNYHGSHDVRGENVPDPALVAPDDIVLRVTATAICGSALHIYLGQAGPRVHGHRRRMRAGRNPTPARRPRRDSLRHFLRRVFFCRLAQFAACETTNVQTGVTDGRGALLNKKGQISGAAMFGYSHLYGGHAGGQAEFVRVPKANAGPFKVPDDLADEDVLLLSYILPTGYQAALNAHIEPGSSVAVFGAGPVVLMAIARLLGPEQIFCVDHHAYRLRYAAETYGAIPINFDEIDDPAEVIIEHTQLRGVDAVIDAVGFEAKGSAVETLLTHLRLEGSSGEVLRQCIAACCRDGWVSVPGVYAGPIHGFLFGDA